MKHEDGDGRRESAVGKRESRGVGLKYGDAVVVAAGVESGGKLVAVVETGDSRDTAAEFGGGSSGTGAEFEQMVAELAVADEPR